MPNRIGRSFVKAYYKYSPPMADFIAKHDSLRAMVRIGLAARCWCLLDCPENWPYINSGINTFLHFLFSGTRLVQTEI